MDFKKTNAEQSIITRNISEIDFQTGNVYQSISIISKRANQLSAKLKEELTNKLAEFASNNDNLEEVFENREQIEISKFYEKLPKPTAMSIQEFKEKNVYFRNPDREIGSEL